MKPFIYLGKYLYVSNAALENMVYFAMKLSLIDEYTHYNSQIELEGKKLIVVD